MADLIIVRLTFTGTCPLLMHNERLANRFDPITKAIAAITKKRKKTEEEEHQIQRLEWEGGLYFDDKLGPYIPCAHVKKCLVNTAKSFRKGKDGQRALTPLQAEIPLSYDGPRDSQGLWDAQRFFDIRGVRLSASSKIQRSRPRFDDWSLTTQMYVNPMFIDMDDLQRCVEYGGMVEGLGDYRPTFGRFEGTMEILET